jgi:hypothetical protein
MLDRSAATLFLRALAACRVKTMDGILDPAILAQETAPV